MAEIYRVRAQVDSLLTELYPFFFNAIPNEETAILIHNILKAVLQFVSSYEKFEDKYRRMQLCDLHDYKTYQFRTLRNFEQTAPLS